MPSEVEQGAAEVTAPPVSAASGSGDGGKKAAGVGGGAVTGDMINDIRSDSPEKQLEAAVQFRKLLSLEVDPPIYEVIHAGVVPRFVELLRESEDPKIKLETAWALTNIASGSSDQTTFVINAGATPLFIELLGSSDVEVQEQAVWALGNIAGDSSFYRDMTLDKGIMEPLIKILDSEPRLSMTRNVVWVMSNLYRGKPQPALGKVQPGVPALAKLIQHGDHEVLTDTCWALSYLSDGPNERIQSVIDAGVVGRIVELLKHDNLTVVTPALRTAGNIATGSDEQTQTVIDAGLLPLMHKLLQSSKESVRKEACWTISNITAGTHDQIQAVIDSFLFPPLVEVLRSGTFATKKEAAWAVSNAASGGTLKQTKYVLNQEALDPMCDLLTVHDPAIVAIALEYVQNILKAGEGAREPDGDGKMVNPFAVMLEEGGKTERIAALRDHENKNVSLMADEVCDKYFEVSEEDDGQEEEERPNSEKKLKMKEDVQRDEGERKEEDDDDGVESSLFD